MTLKTSRVPAEDCTLSGYFYELVTRLHGSRIGSPGPNAGEGQRGEADTSLPNQLSKLGSG